MFAHPIIDAGYATGPQFPCLISQVSVSQKLELEIFPRLPVHNNITVKHNGNFGRQERA